MENKDREKKPRQGEEPEEVLEEVGKEKKKQNKEQTAMRGRGKEKQQKESFM